MSTRKVIILTASYGEGHNSAARALHAAFAEHPGVNVEMIDLFAEMAPRLDRFSRNAYIRLINAAPNVWSRVYRWLDRSDRAPLLFRLLGRHRRALGRLLQAKQPDAICCTYPVYPWLLQQLRSEGTQVPPLYTVITDALSINSLWYRAPSDKWFVTDPDSAGILHQAGIAQSKIHVSGFPVSLAFADRAASLRPPAPGGSQPRRILYMINSRRSDALAIAQSLMFRPDWDVTVTAGRDPVLKRRLEEMARRAPANVQVLGWTTRVPELLMTHHVIISKAGGATTQESINALCPMVVSQIVPGQEEGNWEFMRRNGSGAFADTPAGITQTLDGMFANDGEIWRTWHANLQRIARPAAARDIASHVLMSCHSSPPVIAR